MAKYSQQLAVRKRLEAELARSGDVQGSEFPENRELPVGAPEYYFRRFATALDALRQYRLETPVLESEDERKESRLYNDRARSMVPLRKKAADRMIAILKQRPRDLGEAIAELERCVDELLTSDERTLLNERRCERHSLCRCAEGELWRRSAKTALAIELSDHIKPLLDLYRDPKGFMCAGIYDLSSNITNPSALGDNLYRWGFAALLNPEVRAAFDAASPRELIEAFAEAEGRTRYREGDRDPKKQVNRTQDLRKRLEAARNAIAGLRELPRQERDEQREAIARGYGFASFVAFDRARRRETGPKDADGRRVDKK